MNQHKRISINDKQHLEKMSVSFSAQSIWILAEFKTHFEIGIRTNQKMTLPAGASFGVVVLV